MTYSNDPMWQANRRPTGPVYRPQVQRPHPTYRPQNGLGMLGQLPNEGPPMQQPPQQGYLPTEPGAYQQPGYNTGIVPPGMARPPAQWGFNDGRPGFQPMPNKPPASMGFGDANHFAPPVMHPFLRRFWDRGGR